MTEVEDNRPKWMIELENRKRKPRLAHEAGAGSPCLSCKDACPGLDLHFWRKICKNCKCGRDEHDVVDDDFPQFDLLLGPSGKPRKRAIFLPVANKKQPETERAFDWVPPDITKELAADYMKALPENKLPIQGSAGAALRKQQLQKQLPLHDVDHKACDELSEHERQQFEQYLENLKKYVGQGRVIKMNGAKPFSKSLMTPANAADMQPMSPQRMPHGYTPDGQPVNLRIPSSFVSKHLAQPTTQGLDKQQTWIAANLEAIQAQLGENVTSTGVLLGQYHPVLDKISAPNQAAVSQLINGNRYPAQQSYAELNASNSGQNLNSGVPKMENIQYGPNAARINYQTHYPQAGEQFEINASTETTAPFNLSTDIQLSQATESRVPGNVGNVRYLGDKTNPPKMDNRSTSPRNAPVDSMSGDSGRLSRDAPYPQDMSLENVQLAEKMLSEALLPSSAVHANEIIGSTLDRNKLRYIQEQLSAKYSRDDLPKQHISKSQQIEASEAQYNKEENKHKNSQIKAADKEAHRAAIIAAMRNPSGFLADEQKLERVEPNLANLLEKPRHPQDLGSLSYGDNNNPLRGASTSQQIASGENNNKYATSPYQNTDPRVLGHNDSSISSNIDQQRAQISSPYEESSSSSADLPQRYNHSSSGLSQAQFPNSMSIPSNPLYAHSSEVPYPSVPHEYAQPNSDNNFNSNPARDMLSQRGPNLADDRTRGHGTNLNEPISHHQPTMGHPSLGTEQNVALRAELSYQPINSHVIHSQSSGNPAFPEGFIECPGLRQNPASVDQLRGALEELSVGPIQLHKCNQCKEEIHSGDVVVTAERAKDAVWHPGCFVCSTCDELLVDLVYFYHKGKLYCGRDLATLLNIPRCFACDELIFVREYTVAEGHNYHVKHFCCWDCDMPLAGQQYISENDRPLCLLCYQKTYAKTCKTCNKVIAADQQGVAVKNLDFHANDACFCCYICNKSLLSGRIAIKQDKPFCSKECITEFAQREP